MSTTTARGWNGFHVHPAKMSVFVHLTNLLDKQFVTIFRLHRIALSSTTMFIDLLLVCYLANTTCAIINIMTTLIFIILNASRLHAFFLVVPVRSFLHVLVAVAVISYFQHQLIKSSHDSMFQSCGAGP